MERNESRTGREGGRNVEAVRRAADNRDALDREARRVDATAPAAAGRPVGDAGGGREAGAVGSPEDTSAAREHAREAADNRDALAREARRVDATTPPDAGRERR